MTTTGPSPDRALGWFKQSTSLFEEEAFQCLSQGARLVYLASYAYSARLLTDGRLTQKAVMTTCLQQDADPESTPDELLAWGWWNRTEGGFQVVRYLAEQPSAKQVEEQRRKWREKKAASPKSKIPRGNPRGNPRELPLDLEEEEEEDVDVEGDEVSSRVAAELDTQHEESDAGERGESSRPRVTIARRPVDEAFMTAKHAEYGEWHDVDLEYTRFKNYECNRRDGPYVNEQAAFNSWLSKAEKHGW